MKHSTEYMFDQPRSHYEPELTIVATKRVADAKALKQKITKLKNDAPASAMRELIARYKVAEEAHKHWTKILEED